MFKTGSLPSWLTCSHNTVSSLEAGTFFQCLNDDVASVWLKNKQTKQFLSGTKITYKDWAENDMGKKKQTTSKEQLSKIFRKHCSRPQYTSLIDIATRGICAEEPHP